MFQHFLSLHKFWMSFCEIDELCNIECLGKISLGFDIWWYVSFKYANKKFYLQSSAWGYVMFL